MIKLKTLEFYGIRSFSSLGDDNKLMHKINFHDNLTILQGHNGSGKTTLIEVIGFALTGNVPFSPGKEHMKSFLSTNQEDSQSDSPSAYILLRLEKGDNPFDIEWKLYSNGKKSQRQSNCILRWRQGMSECLNADTARKRISKILEISPSVIQNLLLVRQEETLWPFELTGNELKSRFDELFNFGERNDNLKDLVERRESLRKKLAELEDSIGPAKALDWKHAKLTTEREKVLENQKFYREEEKKTFK